MLCPFQELLIHLSPLLHDYLIINNNKLIELLSSKDIIQANLKVVLLNPSVPLEFKFNKLFGSLLLAPETRLKEFFTILLHGEESTLPFLIKIVLEKYLKVQDGVIDSVDINALQVAQGLITKNIWIPRILKVKPGLRSIRQCLQYSSFYLCTHIKFTTMLGCKLLQSKVICIDDWRVLYETNKTTDSQYLYLLGVVFNRKEEAVTELEERICRYFTILAKTQDDGNLKGIIQAQIDNTL